MRKALSRYKNIRASGGWKNIDPVSKNISGISDSTLFYLQLRDRLSIGLREVSDVSTENVPIEKTISVMQKRYGLAVTGRVTKDLIRQLNVSLQKRTDQILLNMERMRWAPDLPQDKYLLANIPEFRLHVFENGEKKFSIDMVVGKAVHNTVIFSGNLQYVVFSPYWNVPPRL